MTTPGSGSTSDRRRRRHRWAAVVAVLVLASCGGTGGDDGGSEGDDPSTATTAAPSMLAQGIGDPTFPALGNPTIDVTAYDLDLRWEPATRTLDAVATVSLTATDALDAISLDFGPLDVSAVELVPTGAEPLAVDHRSVDDKLVVELPEPLAEGEQVTVRVSYGGSPEPITSVAPVPIGWRVLEGDVVATLSEPDGAHTWFPCNDHPTDKATFHMAVDVPEGLTAVGNGVLESTVTEAGRSVWVWRMDQPMAPYLALVAIDDFTSREQGEAAGVPLRNYLPPGEESLFAGGLSQQPDMVELLVDRLGPYPFLEYGAVVVAGGPIALETQGRSLFEGPSARDRRTVMHEAAHQWFGNSVSVTRWQEDIWWVEGFARFAEWLWIEDTEGAGAYHEVAELAWQGFQFSDWRPLTGLDPATLFSPVSYDGGALAFYALRAELGDEAFFAFLRTFVERYRYGNATTADLVATAEEAAGRPLTDVMDPWLTGGELPALSFG